MMVCWKKVPLASSCLGDVLFDAEEEHVRVCVARSVGSLRILAVGVSNKESNWLAIGSMTLTSSCEKSNSIVYGISRAWIQTVSGCFEIRSTFFECF